MEITSDKKYIKQILSQLVGIDSRNPNLSPDGPGEEEVGSFLADLLADLGLSPGAQTS